MSSPMAFESRSWYNPGGCLLDFVGEAEGSAGRVVDFGVRLFHCFGRRRFVGTVVSVTVGMVGVVLEVIVDVALEATECDVLEETVGAALQETVDTVLAGITPFATPDPSLTLNDFTLSPV